MKKQEEKYRQFGVPDRNEILDIKGEHRSLRDFSRDTGIALATLSRIINGQYTRPLDEVTLRRIAAGDQTNKKEAFKNLMRANGYVTEDEFKTKLHMQRNLEFYREHGRRKEEMKSIIIQELFDRNYDVRKIDQSTCSGLEMPGVFRIQRARDFGIRASDKNLDWFFFVEPDINADPLSSDDDAEGFFLAGILEKYAPLFWLESENPELFENTKHTFVFADDIHFRSFIAIMSKKKYRHAFSAMFVDIESREIKDEEIFPRINGEEEKSEFYNSDRIIYMSNIMYGDGWTKVNIFF